MTTNSKNNKLEKQLKSIAESLGCFGLENIEAASSKIKSLLKDFFPKDKMSFSVTEVWPDASPIVIRITSEQDQKTSYLINPATVVNGELDLYSCLFESGTEKVLGFKIFNFWKSVLKDLPGGPINTRDVLFLSRWIESTAFRECNIIKKENGLSVFSIVFVDRSGSFENIKRKAYVPAYMDKKSLLSHMLVTGRLPYSREAKNFMKQLTVLNSKPELVRG